MKKIIVTILCFVLVFSFVTDVYALGSFPSTTGSLPYDTGTAGPIKQFYYTGKKWYPTSTKKIKVTFYGSSGTNYINYDIGLATALNTFVSSMLTYMPNASGNVSTTYTWSGLNQNTYYAGYMGLNAGSQGTGITAYVRGKYAAG